jgi:hypothetical protein
MTDVLPGIQKQLMSSRESVDSQSDARALQVHPVRCSWACLPDRYESIGKEGFFLGGRTSVARANREYLRKYQPSSHAREMVRSEVLPTTLRLEPR